MSIQDKGNGFYNGSLYGYDFQLKLCNKPSKYGIDEGKVIKLTIRNAKNYDLIANYDRGWDVKPEGTDKNVFATIFAYLSKL